MWFIGCMIEKGEYRDEWGKSGNLGEIGFGIVYFFGGCLLKIVSKFLIFSRVG